MFKNLNTRRQIMQKLHYCHLYRLKLVKIVQNTRQIFDDTMLGLIW